MVMLTMPASALPGPSLDRRLPRFCLLACIARRLSTDTTAVTFAYDAY